MMPLEPIGEQPKECCGAIRNTPFCPVCGTRLTDNKFIGFGFRDLSLDNDHAENEYRHAAGLVKMIEGKYESELEPAKKAVDVAAGKCKQIREAIEYATKHRIGISR